MTTAIVLHNRRQYEVFMAVDRVTARVPVRVVRKRRRKTRAGALIRTVGALVREVEASPSIYWHGRCFPSAFVASMQFSYLVHQMRSGTLRRSVLNKVKAS